MTIFGEFEPVPRWNLMDAITGDDGFALELQTPSGAHHVKAFNAADLPKVSPEKDPMMALGLLPAPTPPIRKVAGA